MSEQTEIHAWAGGQVDSDSHGDVTFGVRRGSFRADLYTDTVELAFEPKFEHGKAWIAARGCAFAAGMMISPWADGAPDYPRQLPVAYAGLELGAQRWGPHGLWAGASGWARYHVLNAYGSNSTRAPAIRADLEGGIWTPGAQATLRAGTGVSFWAESDELYAPIQPHVEFEAHLKPDGVIAPVGELWAGTASHQDVLALTRMGGLTPYAVPMAGAAWGEWWVDDYAVWRVGLGAGSVGMSGAAAPTVRARGQLAADLGVFSRAYGAADEGFNPQGVVGFSASGRLTYKHFYTDLAVGYAPWIPRQEGYSRASVFFRVGLDWAHISRYRDKVIE